ncbi:MAG: hypothetical protein JSS63_15545 [Bacteroidetes bacterium]|nr:hypothetical protein [Bacteroidota bacterium]
MYKAPVDASQNLKFDLIQSVNSNVKFGGFYNGSVNIQISPSMYLKPVSFIGIYASHQKNIFIPIENIKENIPALAAETAGIVLVENSINILNIKNGIVKGIAEFALKNIASLLIHSCFYSSNKKNPQISNFDFYFISAGITF